MILGTNNAGKTDKTGASNALMRQNVILYIYVHRTI